METMERTGNGRRDGLAIMTDLLTNMVEAQRLTHILYKTNLSYTQLRKYLASLIKMGLIEQLDHPFRAFRITQKGRTFRDLITVETIGGNGHNKETETLTGMLR